MSDRELRDMIDRLHREGLIESIEYVTVPAEVPEVETRQWWEADSPQRAALTRVGPPDGRDPDEWRAAFLADLDRQGFVPK